MSGTERGEDAPAELRERVARALGVGHAEMVGSVLDALGLEAIGRLCSRHGLGCHSRCSEPMEVVYRLSPRSDR